MYSGQYRACRHKPGSRETFHRQKRIRLRNSRGSIAEFGPAVALFFALILIPSLSLIRFGLSSTALYFILGQAAVSASKMPTYDQAKQRASREFFALLTSPVGTLCGLKPGNVKSVNLFVAEHLITSGASNAFCPDEKWRKSIDAAINTYEYELRVSYTFEPLLTANSMPIIQSIPLLGEAATITTRAVRPVEFPDGLTAQVCPTLR